ncbi:MAG: Peptidase family M23 [Pelotomaculum sp. PtaB.Bin104]|nr:MAG: Peptidase family M23 [Pelotomaculum sp. PtaB.Bin104]
MATLNASQQARLASQQAQLAGGAAGAAARAAAAAARPISSPSKINFDTSSFGNVPTSNGNKNVTFGKNLTQAVTNNSPSPYNTPIQVNSNNDKLSDTYKKKNPVPSSQTLGAGNAGTPQFSTGPNIPISTQIINPTAPNTVQSSGINQPMLGSGTPPQQVEKPTTYTPSSEVGTIPEATKEYRFFDDYKDSDYFNSLGGKAEPILDYIEEYEKRTGKKVWAKGSEFERLMNQHLEDQKSWENIMNRFGIRQKQEKAQESVSEPTSTTKEFAKVTEEEKGTGTDVATLLNDQGSDTLHSQLEQLLNLDPQTPGEALIRNSLMLSLGAIDDPSIASYLDNMEARATASYIDGIARAKLGREEIDKAMDNTLTDPETYEGMMAKLETKALDLNRAALQETKDYITNQYQISATRLRNQRADLEGYAKAKLYSMGAEDSSAGVALVSKIVSEADLQILASDTEYNHSIAQLNTQGAQLILSYTKNIETLINDVKTQEDTAASNYATKLDEIDKERFTNEAQKRKDTLLAYKEYNDNIAKYREDQKKQELETMEYYTEQAEKIRDYGIKISGITGTIWIPDATGELTDTGIATFEAKKYASDYQKALMTLSVNSDTQRRLTANNLLDAYGSAAAPLVEQLMGLPSGSLEGFQTTDEIKNEIALLGKVSSDMNDSVQDDLDGQNGTVINQYLDDGGGIKTNGLKIDPLSLPDVKSYLLGASSITQKYIGPGGGGTYNDGSHPAIDVVFKDGNVHSIREGTVVNVIPWNGTDPYGGQVWVKDVTGLIWRYAHFGNRNTGGNPFNVTIGQTVDKGEVLGKQGNTGNVTSRKSPKDPTYGVHTHIQTIGYEPESQYTDKTVLSSQSTTAIANYFLGGVSDNKIHLPEGSIPAWTTSKKKVDLQGLKDIYFETFGKEASGADLEALKTRGMDGLQIMIDKRGKNTTTGTNFDLTLNSDY